MTYSTLNIIYLSGRAAGLVEKQPKKVIPVAIKALKDEPSNEQKDEFFREVTLMSILTHPNIVQLLAVSTEEEPYGMVFEFMSGGDLNQYLRNALPAETSLDSDEKAKGITIQNVSFQPRQTWKSCRTHVYFFIYIYLFIYLDNTTRRVTVIHPVTHRMGKPTCASPGEAKRIIKNSPFPS